MIINLTFIENILKNINSFTTESVDLDETGNYKQSGSFEFEVADSEFKLWGGRIIKSGDQYELVEFFPKMFYSDYNEAEWDNLDLDKDYKNDDFSIDED
jgi:hypothetical protein